MDIASCNGTLKVENEHRYKDKGGKSTRETIRSKCRQKRESGEFGCSEVDYGHMFSTNLWFEIFANEEYL